MKDLKKHYELTIKAQTEQINWLLKANDHLKEENRDLKFKCQLLARRLGVVYRLYHGINK